MSEEFNNQKKIDQDASDRDRNLIEAENRAKIADFQTIRTGTFLKCVINIILLKSNFLSIQFR